MSPPITAAGVVSSRPLSMIRSDSSDADEAERVEDADHRALVGEERLPRDACGSGTT